MLAKKTVSGDAGRRGPICRYLHPPLGWTRRRRTDVGIRCLSVSAARGTTAGGDAEAGVGQVSRNVSSSQKHSPLEDKKHDIPYPLCR